MYLEDGQLALQSLLGDQIREVCYQVVKGVNCGEKGKNFNWEIKVVADNGSNQVIIGSAGSVSLNKFK